MAGGLGYGDGVVAAVAAGVIALLVGYVALRRNDIQRPVGTTIGGEAA
jgi:hypothetical protein